MTSKKTSEGIALLSIYGDDEDDEMEDMDAEQQQPQGPEFPPGQQHEQMGNHSTNAVIEPSNIIGGIAVSNGNTVSFVREERYDQQTRVLIDNFTPGRAATPMDSVFSPSPQQKLAVVERRRHERITIVDYGQDEMAMSPEPEEGKIMADGRLTEREELSVINGDFWEKTVQVLMPSDLATHSQFSEPKDQAETNTINLAGNESKSAEMEDVVMGIREEQKEIDLLSKFLPPPPQAKCSDELQARITKFIALKNTGRSYNSEVRNRKDYRNPDFLRHAVTYQDIDEIGSCFSKDVFDPHGYDKSDFYDEIEADMRREMERREQERKRSPKIDFFSGGTQIGTVPTPKINLPNPGLPIVPGSGLNTNTAALDAVPRDGRQNKKTKWDKVDSDRQTLLSTVGQDLVPAAAATAHATLASAANAGSGYSAYAEQRRREAEDKRSMDKSRTEEVDDFNKRIDVVLWKQSKQ